MTLKLNGWYDGPGYESDVVLYTRADLARNISGFLYPAAMNRQDSFETISLVYDFFDTLEEASYFKKMYFDSIDPLGVKLLEERGVLFSDMPETPAKGIVIHDNGAFYIGLNMEDHINASYFSPGFSTEEAQFFVGGLDKKMKESIFFSASEDIGFLTSDIMMMGSGLRFTVLCSLPGILHLNMLSSIAEHAKSFGLNILGYYTPNSRESLGAIFSISTESSAGGNEESQRKNFDTAIKEIIDLERSARIRFAEAEDLKIRDMISRAAAISQSAKLMNFREAADIIFKIKMGLNLGYIKGIKNEECNSMLFKSQMGHVAFLLLNNDKILKNSRRIDESSIEECRAFLIQEVCSNVRII